MKYRLFHLTFIMVFLLMCTAVVAETVNPPPEGGVFPDIVLTVPDNPQYRQYLGLDGKDTFKIPELKTAVVIIEIFSMY